MIRMLDMPNPNVKHIKQKQCNTVRMSLQNRINELLNEQPTIKATDIASYAGISRGAVSDWVNGKTKTIAGENAFKVAKLFNVNAEWVQSGKGRKRNAEKQTAITDVASELTDPFINETNSGYLSLTIRQDKVLDDLRHLLTRNIDPMDLVTLEQIIKLLLVKYKP